MIHTKINMSATKWVSVMACVFFMTGCISKPQGPSFGGIVRSGDGGLTFEPRNVIDEETTLSNTNALSFGMSPRNPNTIYFGTVAKGLYKSDNAGQSWAKVDFAPLRSDQIEINPLNDEVVYVTGVWKSQGMIFRTEDGGENWDAVYVEPVTGTRVSALALGPTNPDIIYAGTTRNSSGQSAIVKSSDAGATWENMLTDKVDFLDLAFDPVNAQQIYALTSKNDILRSEDGGRNWESMTAFVKENDAESFEGKIQSFYVHTRNAGELYVGTSQSLYRSQNYGDSWEEVDIIGTAKGIPIRAISVSPFGDNKLTFASQKVVYVYTGGDKWSITNTETNQAVRFMHYHPTQEDVLYIGFYNLKN